MVFVRHSSVRSREKINVLNIAGGIMSSELYHHKRCLQVGFLFFFFNFAL